jgi:hypothetical protein
MYVYYIYLHVHFYSSPSRLLIRSSPDYSEDTESEFASEGLAQGPYELAWGWIRTCNEHTHYTTAPHIICVCKTLYIMYCLTIFCVCTQNPKTGHETLQLRGSDVDGIDNVIITFLFAAIAESLIR